MGGYPFMAGQSRARLRLEQGREQSSSKEFGMVALIFGYSPVRRGSLAPTYPALVSAARTPIGAGWKKTTRVKCLRRRTTEGHRKCCTSLPVNHQRLSGVCVLPNALPRFLYSLALLPGTSPFFTNCLEQTRTSSSSSFASIGIQTTAIVLTCPVDAREEDLGAAHALLRVHSPEADLAVVLLGRVFIHVLRTDERMRCTQGGDQWVRSCLPAFGDKECESPLPEDG